MKHLNTRTTVTAALLALTLLLTGALTACGGKTTDVTTKPETTKAADATTETDLDALDAKIDAFINEKDNVDAMKEANEQFSGVYDLALKRDGHKLVYEFKFKSDVDITASAESMKKTVEASSNKSYIEYRNALAKYTKYDDAVLVIRYADKDGNTIFDYEITKDTVENDASAIEGDYDSVQDFVEDQGIQAMLDAQATDQLKMIAEAEGDDTLVIKYEVQTTVSKDNLDEIREEEQAMLDGDDIIANLQPLFGSMQALMPDLDIKMKILVVDLDGTELASKTLTAKDFE